jgi:dihydrofolate synthase/folylpolyglutamate synthase
MENQKAYQDTLDYLYSFVDFSMTRGLQMTPDKFELGRMVKLMELLGNPHKTYPILHIAGTKGKGSVSALCASVLRSAGYRTGLYTSPHLHDYSERIQVDGQPIPHEILVSLVEKIKPFVASVPKLTTFEITTALAFMYFAECNVTVAVIEVGLGGRLDATNIVTPVVSVITSISYDHIQVLGNTLREIATEKAGIIKPGIPVVVAPQLDESDLAIFEITQQRGSQRISVGEDFHFQQISRSLQDGQKLLVWKTGEQPEELMIPLLGEHQIQNAATAYAALRVFRDKDYPVSDQAIQNGFQNVRWPGRFEILQNDPYLVVDSAHNRDSARKLRNTLDEYFPDFQVILIFGASEDKDITGMMDELLPRVKTVIATRSFHPRAIEPQKLVELAAQFGKPINCVEKVELGLTEAMKTAKFEMQQNQGIKVIVLATGSIFIAAAVREEFLKQNGQDPLKSFS